MKIWIVLFIVGVAFVQQARAGGGGGEQELKGVISFQYYFRYFVVNTHDSVVSQCKYQQKTQ